MLRKKCIDDDDGHILLQIAVDFDMLAGRIVTAGTLVAGMPVAAEAASTGFVRAGRTGFVGVGRMDSVEDIGLADSIGVVVDVVVVVVVADNFARMAAAARQWV